MDWAQVGTLLGALVAAGLAGLNRREGRAKNGKGKKEPAHTVVLSRLDGIEDKLDHVATRLDDHIVYHREKRR